MHACIHLKFEYIMLHAERLFLFWDLFMLTFELIFRNLCLTIFYLLSSMLVVATSGTGFVLGSGSAIDFTGLCWTCAGTMMVAASASSLNQVQS